MSQLCRQAPESRSGPGSAEAARFGLKVSSDLSVP